MNNELVSVVVPCYNCEDYIERCIRSVLAQSHTEWELILVDNNSTDSSLEVLKKFEAEYPNQIRVFVEPRKGACAARNTGLKHARGGWIQFLDADDELLPEKFTEQLKLLNDNVSFVAGDYIYETFKKRILVRSRKDAFCGLIMSSLGITTANLFNRRFLDDIGGWDEGLSSSQEYDLMFRVMKNNPQIAFDRGLNAVVHKTRGSIMTNEELKYERGKNALGLRLRIRDYLIETNQFNLARRYCFSAFVGMVLLYPYEKPWLQPDTIEFSRVFYMMHRIARAIQRRLQR